MRIISQSFLKMPKRFIVNERVICATKRGKGNLGTVTRVSNHDGKEKYDVLWDNGQVSEAISNKSISKCPQSAPPVRIASSTPISIALPSVARPRVSNTTPLILRDTDHSSLRDGASEGSQASQDSQVSQASQASQASQDSQDSEDEVIPSIH